MQKQKLTAEISNTIVKNIPGILGIWLYGSFANNEQRKESDIDIAFLADRSPLFPERMKLITTLVKLTKHDVDLVDLRTAPTVLQKEIIAYGKRIYCTDIFFCENYETTVFSDYARLNEERAGILSDIQQRGNIYG